MSDDVAGSARGLLDTNILIHWAGLEPEVFPNEVAISAITVAELAAGVHATDDPTERASRMDVLARVENGFDPLPFDIEAARVYGRIAAEVRRFGRSPRARVADQMIAAIAASRGLVLYTTHPGDFAGLERILTMVAVARPHPRSSNSS